MATINSAQMDRIPQHTYAPSGIRRFSSGNYWTSVRCKTCGSDHMLASENGSCQRCLQRTEFVLREGTT